jgi:hypothetical protein
MIQALQKIDEAISKNRLLERLTGRYFLTFWSLILVLTTELALKYLSQEVYKDIVIATVIAFFGGGALSGILKRDNGGNQ